MLEKDQQNQEDEFSEPDMDEEADYYSDSPPMVSPETVAKVQHAFNSDGTTRTLLKARKSSFVHNLIFLDGDKFSFKGREYLLQPYDRDDANVLFKTARQVEKCLPYGTPFLLADGNIKQVEYLEPGERLVSYDSANKAVIDYVKAVQPNGVQPVVRLTTKTGRVVTCTHNHPVKTLATWLPAANVTAGDYIGLPCRAGSFGTYSNPDGAEFTAVMLSEARLKVDHEELSDEVTTLKDRLPSWVLEADRATARGFVRGLWAGDGVCRTTLTGRVDIQYRSAFKQRIEQLERLLLKFGIFTRTLEKVGEEGRPAYALAVVGARSLRRFHEEFGQIIGKPIKLPKNFEEKNDQDYVPREVGKLIHSIVQRGGTRKHGVSLDEIGLDPSPLKKMRWSEFFRYCDFLDDRRLWEIYRSDVYWDEVLSVEELDPEETISVEMENYRNFVTNGVITHNTTFLANNLTVDSVVMPYNKSLYVSPSHTQTRQFSNEKLRPAIEKSPMIKRYFQDHSVSTQVFEKGFTNGSYIFLRSAFRSADRTRGVSVRNLCLDELQDMVSAEIPVIMECTSHFPDARVRMAGTPKTHENTIEYYWQATTQNEWMVPCGCGKWNFLDEQNVAPTEWYRSGKLPPGPVCKKCQKPIDVRSGRWMAFAPDNMMIGYRIPQLMVPWICGLPAQWEKLLWKRDNYPVGQFNNEVLGLSYDSATRPVTRDQLIEICDDYDLWDPENLQNHLTEARKCILTAGVDWGEGNDGSERSPSGKIRNASYTVLTIGTYLNQKQWAVKLVKKYTGRETDPEHVVADITRICQTLGVTLCGVDWGHGWGVNNVLVRKLGANRVVQFQYLPKLKERMKWDAVGYRYHLQRNFMMSEFFFDMQHGHVRFPRWKQIEPYAKDVLAIYSEYVEFRREIRYDHRPSDPDDFFHSMHYAKLSADIHFGKSRRYTQLSGAEA